MTGSADRVPSSDTARQARPAVRDRFVVICLVLAVIAVAPGVMGRLAIDVDATTSYGAALHRLWSTLDDIRFGGGLRFWLGVGGASLMGLLLLYPLRKALSGRRLPGSVGAWFKLHLLIGVFAPVAILYHSNFSTGGMNANVALWTMLAVAVSGIVGHFVYRRASAAFYGDKQAARRSLDGALSLITSLNAMPLTRDRLAEKLDAFDAEMLAPRNGIRASLRARVMVARRKRATIQEAVWLVDEAARAMRLAAPLHAETRLQVARLLHTYFAYAGRAANRSLGEQLWSRWRLFHLPLFLVMCVATGLHIAAVWDMDAPAPSPAAPTPTPVAIKSTPINQVRRQSIAIVPQPPPPAPLVRPTVAPVPAARPTVRPPIPAPTPRPAVAPPESEPAIAVVTSTAAPAADAAKTDGKDLYEELQRRTSDDAPKMSLGNAPRTLEDQIATLKAKMRTREFKHSDAETGFALTGRHTRADCTDCHTVPLKEERSDTPRQCVACHKKDDVHKGRRPLCVDCHTTNSFRERTRK